MTISSRRRVLPRGRRLGAPALLAAPVLLAATALVVHLLPGASQFLEYNRAAILQGQSWRLLSGHWTHASLGHLAWDALTFAALGCALAWRSRALFRRTVLGSAAAISLALLVLAPQWETYRGLSGIDAALFVALAALVWLEGEREPDRWLGACALILFAGKVGFEMLTGSAFFATDTPGHEVVPLAHFVGACVGMAAAILQVRLHRSTTGPNRSAVAVRPPFSAYLGRGHPRGGPSSPSPGS